MPEILRHSFHPRTEVAVGAPTTAPAVFFRWVDDPTEDADFEAYLNRGYFVTEASVDRTGPEPVLTWREGEVRSGSSGPVPPPVYSEPIGPVGTIWSYGFEDPTPSGGGGQGGQPVGMTFIVTKFTGNPPGYWECDEYGRPFDLDDLVAPPAP